GSPLASKFEPWKIPTNMIREPLSSFSVARGVAPLVQRLIGYDSLGVGPAPNQICVWGITNDPCRIYFAYPVANAASTMDRLAVMVPKLISNLIGPYLGDIRFNTNR